MFRARTHIRLSLILLIIQSSSYAWKLRSHGKEDLCKTPECKTRGEEYKQNMNTDIDPCEDFYTFTCGNWKDNYAPSKYAPERTVENVLDYKFTDILRDLLETYTFQEGEDISFSGMKQIYDICTKSPEYPIKKASDIAKEVKTIGYVPNTPLWDMHLKYLQLSGVSAFFRIKYQASQTAKGIILVIMFLEPMSPYGSIYHENIWKPPEKQAYTEFLFQIMKSLKLKDSDAVIKERVEKVFEFRRKLNLVINQNKNSPPDIYEPLTGEKLHDWFQENVHNITDTQNIPWIQIVEELLKDTSPEARKIVGIRRREYFLDLMDLLKDETEEVLASHIQMFFVEENLQLKSKMYTLLETTSVEPHDLLRTVRERLYPRWYTCIQMLNMKETLEKLAYEKWFPKIHASIVYQLTADIKKAIENQVTESNWLDNEARRETLARYRSVEEWIGFPPWIHGEGDPKPREKKEILLPQASFNVFGNSLYVHAPLLLPPIYSPSIPPVYNYAGMGTTIGHELYHVIDDCGSYHTRTRTYSWWPLQTQKKCQTWKNLFINVYKNITERELQQRFDLNVTFNASCTVLEDYPDVMGLEAAYNAYKEAASTDPSVCKTLPKFEKFTCDQMFYIAFANSYCGYYTKKAAERKIEEEAVHSLDFIRVNGAVAQMESFGTAFKCPDGSPMNPEERVNLWK